MAGLQGLGGDGSPNIDALGIFFIVFTILWNLFVFGGLLWLYMIRDTVAIRIRNYWLLASAVVMLSLYEICVLVRYPMNATFKCAAEFWVMSTILPLSIALFQASNLQLLSHYEEQQHVASLVFRQRANRSLKLTLQGIHRYWNQLITVQKVCVGITIGMILQLIVTFIIYFGSRTFHPGYGFFGRYSRMEKCRQTLEWVPSIFWQFLWSAVFGPYLLIRIRSIKDTHYWALQTKLAVLASLPGTPLWLAFRSSDTAAVRAVNRYLVPASWIIPGLITMQLVSIVIPILDARKQATYTKRASSIFSDTSSKSRDQHSMSALELLVEHNIEPLLEWTAKREFTAENIVFLKTVRDFKRKWRLAAQDGELSSSKLRERFEDAGHIFYNLVNPHTALFNINIDSVTYYKLESMFSSLFNITQEAQKESNAVAPWGDSDNRSISKVRLVDDVDRLYHSRVTGIELRDSPNSIPVEFNIAIFDRAFTSIKYLVFTNSWVKFVDAQETASMSGSTYSLQTKV